MSLFQVAAYVTAAARAKKEGTKNVSKANTAKEVTRASVLWLKPLRSFRKCRVKDTRMTRSVRTEHQSHISEAIKTSASPASKLVKTAVGRGTKMERRENGLLVAVRCRLPVTTASHMAPEKAPNIEIEINMANMMDLLRIRQLECLNKLEGSLRACGMTYQRMAMKICVSVLLARRGCKSTF